MANTTPLPPRSLPPSAVPLASLHRPALWAAAAILAIALVTACSSDADDSSADQVSQSAPVEPADVDETMPVAGTQLFGEGDFDDVPLVPGSNQIGPVDRLADGVISATYTVNQFTAARTIQTMAELLATNGWDQLVAPVERPEGAFRTEWARDGRRVEVVATDVTGLDDSSRMQYSVILHPDLDDVDVDAGEASTD